MLLNQTLITTGKMSTSLIRPSSIQLMNGMQGEVLTVSADFQSTDIPFDSRSAVFAINADPSKPVYAQTLASGASVTSGSSRPVCLSSIFDYFMANSRGYSSPLEVPPLQVEGFAGTFFAMFSMAGKYSALNIFDATLGVLYTTQKPQPVYLGPYPAQWPSRLFGIIGMPSFSIGIATPCTPIPYFNPASKAWGKTVLLTNSECIFKECPSPAPSKGPARAGF
jgi:hypothetical protein